MTARGPLTGWVVADARTTRALTGGELEQTSWTLQCDLARPWLSVSFPHALRCLSWAPVGGGFTTARTVLWREVRDADLTVDFDAPAWLRREMLARASDEAIGLLTSRNVALFTRASAVVENVSVAVCATVGLSNAERVGTRRGAPHVAGTINVVCATNAPLTHAAQVEALSVATQARTAAILDVDRRVEAGRATGTGTDCIVLGCAPGDVPYAGTHTAVGEAIGSAVYTAVKEGAEVWMARYDAG